MAGRTNTDEVRGLLVSVSALQQWQVGIDKLFDHHNPSDLEARLRVAEDRVAELAKARELSGNRLFQIGVAVLTAQFSLIIPVIGALPAALLRK